MRSRLRAGWLVSLALACAATLGAACGDEGSSTDAAEDRADAADEAGGTDADADVPAEAEPEADAGGDGGDFVDDAPPADDGGSPPEVAVGVTERTFTYDGVETFVLAASYYGATGAAEDVIRSDLAGLAALGFNNVRVWTTWSAPTVDVSVVRNDGSLDPTALARLRFVLETARGLGMTVDVTFNFGLEGMSDGGFDNYRNAMVQTATELLPFRNAWFDLGNERDVGDFRYLSVEQVRDLAVAVRAVDPGRLVTASGGGSSGEDAAASWTELFSVADLDFATPHFSRDDVWAAETEARVTVMRDLLHAAGWDRPVYLQEEARRGYGAAEWPKEMFLTAVAGARRAGAAGWCFHTDAGFDMSLGSFFDQLDDVERDTIDELAAAAAP